MNDTPKPQELKPFNPVVALKAILNDYMTEITPACTALDSVGRAIILEANAKVVQRVAR